MLGPQDELLNPACSPRGNPYLAPSRLRRCPSGCLSCPPCSRPSSSCLLCRAVVFEGAADLSYSCYVGSCCPSARAAADSLPGQEAGESPGLLRDADLQVHRGKQAVWSCPESPWSWGYGSTVSPPVCHVQPLLGGAGASAPSASDPTLHSLVGGLPAAALLSACLPVLVCCGGQCGGGRGAGGRGGARGTEGPS